MCELQEPVRQEEQREDDGDILHVDVRRLFRAKQLTRYLRERERFTVRVAAADYGKDLNWTAYTRFVAMF